MLLISCALRVRESDEAMYRVRSARASEEEVALSKCASPSANVFAECPPVAGDWVDGSRDTAVCLKGFEDERRRSSSAAAEPEALRLGG